MATGIRFSLITRLAFAFLAGATAPASHAAVPYFQGQAPRDVEAAHEAYLKRDFKVMNSSIVEALQVPSTDPLIKENLAALLESAYASNQGNLPSAFDLPDTFEWLALVSRRAETGNRADKAIEIKGRLKQNIRIEELQLIKYPSEVLLDRQNPKMEFKESNGSFYLKAKHSSGISDGLYQISLKTSDGFTLKEWVPLFNFDSPASPAVTSPSPEEILRERNPRLEWRDPAQTVKGHFRRSLSVEVIFNAPPDYGWEGAWSLWDQKEGLNTATVGKEKDGVGVSALERGRYLANITYKQERKFGDLTLSLQSAGRSVFHIR